ncbi:MAG: AAA family ATPase [Acidobacteriota bacterium]
MVNLFALCPTAPQWRVEWESFDRQLAFIRALRGCPQNPTYHAEGDVWTHTRLVCESMAQDEAWRALDEESRQDLFAAALLHDSAKPHCTKVQPSGRVTSRGHARRGALLARRLLWSQGVPAERRERICRLVRHHMAPLYLRDSEQPRRQVLRLSHCLRCDHLATLGRADALGRICDDADDLWERHQAFEAVCRSEGCLDRPYEFPSSHARFLFFRQLLEDPQSRQPEPETEVVLLSGLPGSGRDRWLESSAGSKPVIDLDALRRRQGIGPLENQGAVIALARDRARSWLSRGRSLIWRDMNLSRQLREHLIGLFAGFEARVRIVHLEAEREEVEQRLASDPLYGEVDLDFLLDRWEVPDATEAHEVELHAP